MPKQLYPFRSATQPRRWRVVWRTDDGRWVAGYYRTKVVAIMDAYWRILISPGWKGEVILFDQAKGE